MIEEPSEAASNGADPKPYLDIAASQLASILARSDTPFVNLPPPGSKRGIDVYRARDLVSAVARSIELYVGVHARLPNLVYPASLSEKLLWSKFFTPIPFPAAGDKLVAATYLPAAFRSRIAVPARIWTSAKPTLPANDEILAGAYFLKANHGSGYNLPIRYPLTAESRATAEASASTWLAKDYGSSFGQWWYSGFERRLLLEAHVGDPDSDVPDWKFWVLNGRVHFAQISHERTAVQDIAYYARDFQHLPVTNRWYAEAAPISKPDAYDEMVKAAEAIGRRFSFVRVDFYLPPSGPITLGEITLCPGNAQTPFSPVDFDYELGEHWDPTVIGSKE
jgi:TupA-like ATPgrasp